MMVVKVVLLFLVLSVTISTLESSDEPNVRRPSQDALVNFEPESVSNFGNAPNHRSKRFIASLASAACMLLKVSSVTGVGSSKLAEVINDRVPARWRNAFMKLLVNGGVRALLGFASMACGQAPTGFYSHLMLDERENLIDDNLIKKVIRQETLSHGEIKTLENYSH